MGYLGKFIVINLLFLVPALNFVLDKRGLLTKETYLVNKQQSGKHDFDFLIGKEWTVQNKVLKERLVGSQQWEEFNATLTDVRKIVDGLGNIDKFYGYRNDKYFEGVSIRVYNPIDASWTIHWVDNISAKLTYQVQGRFENGVGTFLGEEPFNGENVKLRFLWSHNTDSTAKWEQAYWHEKEQIWEVNWIMNFTLIK